VTVAKIWPESFGVGIPEASPASEAPSCRETASLLLLAGGESNPVDDSGAFAGDRESCGIREYLYLSRLQDAEGRLVHLIGLRLAGSVVRLPSCWISTVDEACCHYYQLARSSAPSVAGQPRSRRAGPPWATQSAWYQTRVDAHRELPAVCAVLHSSPRVWMAVLVSQPRCTSLDVTQAASA